MEKKRSPNYPSLNLREALERGRRIYLNEHRHAAPKDAMLKDLGFTGPNGASLTVFGALRAYGIVEPSGNDYRISEAAMTAFESPEREPARVSALDSMAFAPRVFSDLRGEFGVKPPGEHTLRIFLMKREFTSKAADEVIRVYRENLELVGAQNDAYTEVDPMTEPEVRASSEPRTVGVLFQREMEKGKTLAEGLGSVAEHMKGAPLISQTLVISMPRNLRVDIGVRGSDIKKDDLAKIKSQFTRWIEGLEEAFED